MNSNPPSSQATGITGILIHKDRIAIYTGDNGHDSVRVMQGASSPFGPEELLGLLASAISGGWLSNKVAIGVDPSLEFFSTQRTISFQDGGKAESLIDELRSKHGGRMVAESLCTSLSAKTHQTAIAVPSAELEDATMAFSGFSGSARFISTTHAMYAFAVSEEPTPRKWKSEIRVFIGSQEGLILFAVDGTLVARHIFEYSGQAQGAVITAVNGIVAAVQEGLALDQPSGVIFHVGQDSPSLAELCTEITGLEAISRTNIVYDQATLGAAVAFEGFRRRRLEIDFLAQETAKQEKKNKKAGTNFPVKSMAGLAAVIFAMGGSLWHAGSQVQDQIDGLYAEADTTLARFDYDAQLMFERLEEIRATANVGEGFLMNRVYWADFLTELPDILPPTVDLVAISADYPFLVPEEQEDGEDDLNWTVAALEDSRFFELVVKAPLAGKGSSIPELTQMIAGLTASTNFRRYFQEIPGPAINPVQTDDGNWVANITLRCKP